MQVSTTRADVLKALSIIIDESTIIVGHSLASDFDALGIVHTRVVDTAELYPHAQGWPFKRSLKDIALSYLGKEVQAGETGHSPIVDAATAFELAIHFIMTPEDSRHHFFPRPWSAQAPSIRQDRHTLFHHIVQSGVTPSHSINGFHHGQVEFVHYNCQDLGTNMNESFCLRGGLEVNIKSTHLEFERDRHLSPGDLTYFSVKEDKQDSFSKSLESLKRDLTANHHLNNSNDTSVHIINFASECGDVINESPGLATGKSTPLMLDIIFRDIYEVSPSNSLLLVISQADISIAKRLLARKQR